MLVTISVEAGVVVAVPLSPFVDYGEVAIVCGNLGMVAAIVVLQLVAAYCMRCLKPDQLWDEVLSFVYFPGAAIVVFTFFDQGTVLACVKRLLVAQASGLTTLGVVGVLIVTGAGTSHLSPFIDGY